MAIEDAPTGRTDPLDATCTQVSAHEGCVYRNCRDAHKHGRYDIPQDDPEYCPAQDRDNDGIACES
ncbi:excalibur calcium-binding domain-containing protein [Mycobacterium basiliense]